jgi:GNAT superfamily N-acetyltransferase
MSLLRELIESDARYFELGARVETVEGAVIAWVPGFADLAAGCVIQRVKPAELCQGHEGWIQRFEQRLGRLGAAWSRIYLSPPHDALEQALATAGYCRRVELAFVSMGAPSTQVSGVRLRPVRSQEDWRLKAGLHSQHAAGSDGYHHDPARWVALMRKKAATGFKEPYLIEQGDRVVGEVALMDMEHLVRLKNLFILPEARGLGLGAAAVALAWGEAGRRGKGAIGVLGIEGSAGARLYHRCGLRPGSQLTEWSRRL